MAEADLFKYKGFFGLGKVFVLLLVFVFACSAFGESASGLVAAGNKLYGEASFDEAIGEYDKAVEIDPEAYEAMFNKGASLFRKGEINKAIELFRDVAAGSRDKELAGKAKYNLGNSYFRRALEQKEPDAKKAMADYKASVNNWRQVLDMDKSNASAGRNVEIAKAAIRKLKEEQQQEQQKQQGEDGEEGDEDKEKQKQEQQDQEKQEGDKDKEKQQQDQQDQKQGEDQQGEEEKDERQKAMDALAEDILRKEKEDRKKRQMLLLRREPVEKDW